jgi:ethanolamine ammonia-lyase large subunit
MTDEKQLEQFGEAVARKNEAAKAASEQQHADHPNNAQDEAGEQSARVDDAHQQDDRDVRAKNSGHGKKTADKWNQ